MDHFKVLCFQGENVKIHRKFAFLQHCSETPGLLFKVSCLFRTSVLLRAYCDNLKANLQNQTNTSLLRVTSRPNEKELQTPRFLKISENAHSASCHLPFLPVTAPSAVCTCWVWLLQKSRSGGKGWRVMINKTHNKKVKSSMRSQSILSQAVERRSRLRTLPRRVILVPLCLHFNSSGIYWVIPR